MVLALSVHRVRRRHGDAIGQVDVSRFDFELDDLAHVLAMLPALVSSIELEPRLHGVDEPRELHRARAEPTFPIRFHYAGTTVRSSGLPRRSLKQDWKRSSAPIGRYACATFGGPPSARFRAGLLASWRERCAARTPIVLTSVHTFIWPFSRAARRPCSGRALYAP